MFLQDKKEKRLVDANENGSCIYFLYQSHIMWINIFRCLKTSSTPGCLNHVRAL